MNFNDWNNEKLEEEYRKQAELFPKKNFSKEKNKKRYKHEN